MKNKLKHLAVVIDGNRRWAKSRNLQAWKGHEAGAENVDRLLDWCKELGIKEITIYTLSTENLKRNPLELNFLFDLFVRWFKKLKKDKRIKKDRIKIRFIGDLSLVPKNIAELAKEIERDTFSYENFKINFCFAYGGRLELLQAINKLKNKKGKITEKEITNALWLQSEPDLIIRTGEQKRLSNFLPWQSVYSELIFSEKMWPDFSKEDLISCIKEFKKRKRNFGR